MSAESETWPAGLTWAFQGTVAEDATAGTHICTLTVTPGAGNEMSVTFWQITDGNTATAQTLLASVDDGTNELARLSGNTSHTVANQTLAGPSFTSETGTTNTPSAAPVVVVSGTMRLKLSVTTTAVSVTQTFALVCRLRGGLPTATLLDTIGTSVNTINTNQVF